MVNNNVPEDSDSAEALPPIGQAEWSDVGRKRRVTGRLVVISFALLLLGFCLLANFLL